MTKITRGGTVEAPTYTVSEVSLTDYITAPLTGFFSALSSEESDIFYDTKTVGVIGVGMLAAGIFAGDRYGDSIPVLGRGR